MPFLKKNVVPPPKKKHFSVSINPDLFDFYKINSLKTD